MSKHRGDTIVEVLFAMVVIGVSLAAAFGIANRGLQISRASQERTEAQKIAESQIELIKAALSSDSDNVSGQVNSIIARITNPSQNFCLYRDNNGEVDIANKNANNSPCQGITPLDSAVEYGIDISFERSGPGNSGDITEFAVTVTWDRIGTNSDEPGTLTLYYRPGVVSNSSPIACSTGAINLSEYAKRNDVSGGNLNVSIRVNDVSMGSATSLFNNLRSSPDIIMSNPINTTVGCNYELDYTVYCSVNQNARPLEPLVSNQNPSFFGLPPDRCFWNGQNAESIIVSFYENYSGNRSNAQCNVAEGPVARFTTEDAMNGEFETTVFRTVRLNILRDNAEARCIELQHFCDANRSVPQCNNGSSNSVQLHLIDWREV